MPCANTTYHYCDVVREAKLFQAGTNVLAYCSRVAKHAFARRQGGSLERCMQYRNWSNRNRFFRCTIDSNICCGGRISRNPCYTDASGNDVCLALNINRKRCCRGVCLKVFMAVSGACKYERTWWYSFE